MDAARVRRSRDFSEMAEDMTCRRHSPPLLKRDFERTVDCRFSKLAPQLLESNTDDQHIKYARRKVSYGHRNREFGVGFFNLASTP